MFRTTSRSDNKPYKGAAYWGRDPEAVYLDEIYEANQEIAAATEQMRKAKEALDAAYRKKDEAEKLLPNR